MSKQSATALYELQGENSLKAWSVIITFFGDSVAPRGGAISTTTIQAVMAQLGIGAGAVRTAFSRLARDGWVSRQKVGRNTYYSLSATGQAPFAEAEAVIYAGPSKTADSNDKCWLLVTRRTQQTQKNELHDFYSSGIRLNKDSTLFHGLSPRQLKILSTDQALISSIDRCDIPQWVIDQVAPATIAENYTRLQQKADQLCAKPQEEPLHALAIRTLLVHEWRRLLLRRDESNTALLPADWPYEDCRQAVSTLYRQLTPAAESWLDTQATGPLGALAKPDIDTLQRFR